MGLVQGLTLSVRFLVTPTLVATALSLMVTTR